MAFNTITVPFTGLGAQLFEECGLGDAVFADLRTVENDEEHANDEVDEGEVTEKFADATSQDMINAVATEFTSSSVKPIPSVPTPPLTPA